MYAGPNSKNRQRPAISCWLVQDAASGWVVLQAALAGARQSSLGETMLVDAGGVRVAVAGSGNARSLSADALPRRVSRLSEPAELYLETSNEAVRVAPAWRPLGALGWGCDRGGMTVQSPRFGSWQTRWSRSELRIVRRKDAGPAAGWAIDADPAPHPDAKGALQFGIYARFGIYAELTVKDNHGSATQRLRWIEPGTFLMGSPDDEPGYFDDEGPQHEVTISKGFWLFDTPCRQALWQAVMGENPSYFKDPDRPVEQVNWDDVQAFLKRINALVPGLDLVLPTEAQWEYACRAGTETAIYSGNLEILGECNAPALDAIAWYSGNSGVDFDLEYGVDSSDWPAKQYPHTRAGIRRVGSKEPNAWGLYEMHGNVWEWCADHWHGAYAGGDAWIDADAEAGAYRVLRGGSWINYARYVRSAYRDALVPGYRNYYLGFRCARVQQS